MPDGEADLLRVTLDTNCIIALEEARPLSTDLKNLLELRGSKVRIQVSAMGASEKQAPNGWADNFSVFTDKLANVGLQDSVLLWPLRVWGITFHGADLWGEDESGLDDELHRILFPRIPKELDLPMQADAAAVGKWRNARCDVQSLWCHAQSEGAIFVTSDGNFHKETKHSRLESLCKCLIRRPETVLETIASWTPTSFLERPI